MNLLETAGNPAPEGASVRAVATADGTVLRAAHWLPPTCPLRGTVVLLHGRAEFIEKYFEVIGELLGRGFAVATFDWRGQGSSGRTLADGRKGHVTRFSDFRQDVDAVFREVVAPLPKPVFGLAHSMGGCIALAGAAEGWLPVDRLVATTPMVALSLVRHARLARWLARALGWLGLSGRLVPGGRMESISTEPFDGNRLSGDAVRYARNADVAAALGPGAIGSPTIGWLNAAFDAMAAVQAEGFGARVGVPTLVVGAGADPVCSTPATELLARSLGPGSTYLAIPGSRHEVLMESDAIRETFWRAFDAFVPGSPETAEGLASAAEPIKDALVQTLVPAGDDGAAGRGRPAVP